MKKLTAIFLILTYQSISFADEKACRDGLLKHLQENSEAVVGKLEKRGSVSNILDGEHYPKCEDLQIELWKFPFLVANEFLSQSAECEDVPGENRTQIRAVIKMDYDVMLKERSGPISDENYVGGSNKVVVANYETQQVAHTTIAQLDPDAYPYVLSSLAPLAKSKIFTSITMPKYLACWDHIKTKVPVTREVYNKMSLGIETIGITENNEALAGQKIYVQYAAAGQDPKCEFLPMSDVQGGKHFIYSDQFLAEDRPVISSIKVRAKSPKTFYGLYTKSGFYYLWNKDSNNHSSPILVQATGRE